MLTRPTAPHARTFFRVYEEKKVEDEMDYISSISKVHQDVVRLWVYNRFWREVPEESTTAVELHSKMKQIVNTNSAQKQLDQRRISVSVFFSIVSTTRITLCDSLNKMLALRLFVARTRKMVVCFCPWSLIRLEKRLTSNKSVDASFSWSYRRSAEAPLTTRQASTAHLH